MGIRKYRYGKLNVVLQLIGETIIGIYVKQKKTSDKRASRIAEYVFHPPFPFTLVSCPSCHMRDFISIRVVSYKPHVVLSTY